VLGDLFCYDSIRFSRVLLFERLHVKSNSWSSRCMCWPFEALSLTAGGMGIARRM